MKWKTCSCILQRIAEDPDKKLKISKDCEFTENPMDMENVEENINAEDVKSLTEVFEATKEKGFADLEYVRVPVVEESAPQEICFDILEYS